MPAWLRACRARAVPRRNVPTSAALAQPTPAPSFSLSPKQAPGPRMSSIAGSRLAPGVPMLHYAVVFFVIALIAALFGFGGIAAGAAGIAKILFVVFIILAIAS